MKKTGNKSVQPGRDGLPATAFAVIGDPQNPATWLLPHHRTSISSNKKGKEMKKTVDWELMLNAVEAISRRRNRPVRIEASPGEIISIARHLAGHYRQAGKPLPDILAALL